MVGYTTRFSVDLIDELLDNGHFSRHKDDVWQAIHDLEVHKQYNNVSPQRYNYLRTKLSKLEKV